ncbi:Phosphoglycolate phosphatase [Candidatus Terasakiella magnetica]|nr:Phosphoglycolate phosphatase [Candidatus Terasakiella magnetica]
MSSGLKAVLFDLDGTLIHSLPDLAAAVNRLLASERRAPLSDDAVKAMVGDGAHTLVERAFSARGGLPGSDVRPYLARFLDDYEARSVETTVPWPGVPQTLAYLKADGLRLAVCTNKPSKATADILQALNLSHFFDLVVGADDTPALKPDPVHVTVILERLGVTAEQAVMVGDSANDILSAKAAGVRTIALSFGYAHGPVEDLGADVILDGYSELPLALTRMNLSID